MSLWTSRKLGKAWRPWDLAPVGDGQRVDRLRRLMVNSFGGCMWSTAVIAIVTNLPGILEGMNRLFGRGPATNKEKHATAVRQLEEQEKAAGLELGTGALESARDAAIAATVTYQNELQRAIDAGKVAPVKN